MEHRLVDLGQPGSRRIAVGLPEARSRHDLLRHACAVVLDVGRRRGDDVAIVVRQPALGPADVRLAFDEISEKLHVTGIELRFDEDEDGRLQAIFTEVGLNGAIR